MKLHLSINHFFENILYFAILQKLKISDGVTVHKMRSLEGKNKQLNIILNAVCIPHQISLKCRFLLNFSNLFYVHFVSIILFDLNEEL